MEPGPAYVEACAWMRSAMRAKHPKRLVTIGTMAFSRNSTPTELMEVVDLMDKARTLLKEKANG